LRLNQQERRGIALASSSDMPTLLVLDDEQSILSFVAKAMVRRGWSVVEVDSVDAGLAVTRSQTIDVALCDVVMPNAGGPEFARAMQSGTANVPVVLMTGHPSASLFLDQPLPRWWRPLPLLEKPFTLGELEEALATALDQKDPSPDGPYLA
jgi:DNA-binding NtrC family response regulator